MLAAAVFLVAALVLGVLVGPVDIGLGGVLESVAARIPFLHVHSPLSPVLPILAIEEADSPVVGTFHTYFDRSKGYSLFNDFFQKRLDTLAAAICVSHSTTVALER